MSDNNTESLLDSVKLHDFQQKGLENFKDWFPREGREGAFLIPTGTGKTVLACACVRHVYGILNRKVLWIVHRDEILKQGAERLRSIIGCPVGIEKAGKKSKGEPIVVGSVQSLVGKRLASFAERFDPGLIVFDEAHHGEAPTWLAIKMAFPNAKVLNLTATPFRADVASELDLGEELLRMSTAEAIEKGILTPPKTVGTLEINLNGVRISKDDYVSKSLTKILMQKDVIDRSVALIARHIPGRKGIVFAASVEHGKTIAEELRKFCTVGEVYADTDETERKRIYDGVRRGDVNVIVNYGVLTEGFDLDVLDLVAILRATKNSALYLQMLGRGLRSAPNKKECLVIDAMDVKKRAGKSKMLVLPNEVDVRKYSAMEYRQVSPCEVFMSWFYRREEVMENIKTRKAPVSRLASAEDVFAALFPDSGLDCINSAQRDVLAGIKDALSDTETPLPGVYAKLARAMKSAHVETFVKCMLNNGWAYYPNGILPSTLEKEAKIAADLEKAANSQMRDFTMSVLSKFEPELKNFVMDVLGKKSLTSQAADCYKTYDTFGKRLVWAIPVGIKNPSFTFIEISKEKDANLKGPLKSFFVRREDDGAVSRAYLYGGKLNRMEPVRSKGEFLPLLPTYCLGARWGSERLSSAQVSFLAKLMKVGDGDVEKMNFSKMAGACLISSHLCKSQLKAIEAGMARVREIV